MKLRRVTAVGVLALVAMLLPALLVSAAPPFRTFTATRSNECLSVEGRFWQTGQAIHWRDGEALQQVASSDPAVNGVLSLFTPPGPGYNGFVDVSPGGGSFRIVLGAYMLDSSGACAAEGMDSPDYWEGIWRNNRGTWQHGCVSLVGKGYGQLRGLEMRAEYCYAPDVLTGRIIETGGY